MVWRLFWLWRLEVFQLDVDLRFNCLLQVGFDNYSHSQIYD
jgi:hypothetical protein